MLVQTKVDLLARWKVVKMVVELVSRLDTMVSIFEFCALQNQ